MAVFPVGKNTIPINIKNASILVIALIVILLTVDRVDYPLLKLKYPLFSYSNSAGIKDFPVELDEDQTDYDQDYCHIFTGEWIPDPEAPYYTNTTCRKIHEHRNCMKYGRPDREFMQWRWKPEGCDLPVFDPYEFLDIVRDKSMAFVGDSLAENHMLSLMCLLSRVEQPVDDPHEYFPASKYKTYNFTITNFWAPYLVKAVKMENSNMFNIYLDEFNTDWTNLIDEFDYVIISAGHWFPRPSMYYENHQLVGCNLCQNPNITSPISYAYRRAFRTAFKALNTAKNYRGITFLRTISPSHFENGKWDTGGYCTRQRPFSSNETVLDGMDLDFYRIQLEEYKAAKSRGKKKGLKYKLIDLTRAMLLRPDGHPNRYWHWPGNVTLGNDCLHWCLPGAIDTWNDFLLYFLNLEGIGSPA